SPFNEINHYLFQLFSVHLTMYPDYPCVRHQLFDQVSDGINFRHTVVYKKYLPAPVNFGRYGIAYSFLVESINLRGDRLSVGGRGGDDGQVPGAHQRKMQRSWNGCR